MSWKDLFSMGEILSSALESITSSEENLLFSSVEIISNILTAIITNKEIPQNDKYYLAIFCLKLGGKIGEQLDDISGTNLKIDKVSSVELKRLVEDVDSLSFY